MNNTLVSVILPVYREPCEFITKSIISILNQTYNDIELIIILDTGVDNDLYKSQYDCIVAVVDKYAETKKNIKIVVNEKNLGPSQTINRGIYESRGRYIAIMHADDIAHPERIEKQVKFLMTNDKFDMCCSRVFYIDKYDKVLGESKYVSISEIPKYLYCGLNPFTHASWLAKREFFLDLGGYRDIAPVEDYDLLCRAFISGKRFVMVDEVLLYSRIHETETRLSNAFRMLIPCMVIKTSKYLRRLTPVPISILDECKKLVSIFPVNLLDRWENTLFTLGLLLRRKYPRIFNLFKFVIYSFSFNRLIFYAYVNISKLLYIFDKNFKQVEDRWMIK